MPNCVDIVRPFSHELPGLNIPVQIIGGIGSAALTLDKTVILPNEQRIIAPADFALPTRRDDGNLRDVDVLVLSSNPADVKSVQDLAESTIGEALEISVFGLHNRAELEPLMRQPLGFRAFRMFVSDRYINEPSPQDIQKILFPFAVPIVPASLEPWTLEIGDTEFSVPHPGTAIINYTNRSISGLRPKDTAKIERAIASTTKKYPQIADWIVDGDGKSQFELTRLLYGLRQRSSSDLVLGEKLTIKPITDPRDREAFMLHDYPELTQKAALAIAAFKARGLGFFETNPRLVTLWQKFAERRAAKLVTNS